MKERLLSAALELMLKKGFSATRVDEICEQAQASKGSFYHFFASKEDLGLATLAWRYERAFESLFGGPYQTEPDPIRRVFGMLNHTKNVSAHIWGEGSLMGAFAVEMSEISTAMRRQVSGLFDTCVSTFSQVLEPVADLNPEGPSARELGEHFMQLLEGASVMARAHGKPQFVNEAIERFRAYITLLVTSSTGVL